MLTSWEQLLQLLWPQNSSQMLPITDYRPRSFADVVYLLPYQLPATKVAIKANKYRADKAAATSLALLVDQYLTTLSEDFVIIPMPVSHKRWRERGYNHIDLLLKQSRYSAKVNKNILTKSSHTKQQTRVSKQERITQQIGTFKCHPARCSNLPTTVILLDDVVTTGGTMHAAQAALVPDLPPNTRLVTLAIAH